MNALIPAVVQLLAGLADRFFPGGRDNAAAPSTVVGLAEVLAVLTAVGVSEDWAQPVALIVLGGLGIFNLFRRERGPPPGGRERRARSGPPR